MTATVVSCMLGLKCHGILRVGARAARRYQVRGWQSKRAAVAMGMEVLWFRGVRCLGTLTVAARAPQRCRDPGVLVCVRRVRRDECCKCLRAMLQLICSLIVRTVGLRRSGRERLLSSCRGPRKAFLVRLTLTVKLH